MSKSDVGETVSELFEPTIRPELMSACRDVESDLNANANEITRLTEKIKTIVAALPVCAELVNRTAERKSDILAAHAVDLASSDELAAARGNHDAAVKAQMEAQELHSAVKKALSLAESKTSQLQTRKVQAEKAVWREFHKQTLVEITRVAGGLFVQADLAARLLGADFQGNPFTGVHPSQVAVEIKRLRSKVFETL